MVRVKIPQVLQKLTENKFEVEIEGKNIIELVDNLEKEYKGIKERICDEEGKIRRFINIYVNNEDVRFLEGQDTKLKDGDEVSIIPAIAGGKNEIYR